MTLEVFLCLFYGFATALIICSIFGYFIIKRNTAYRKSAELISQRLEATLNASLDAIIVTNKEGIVIDYNGSAEIVFGYSRNEIIGNAIKDLIVPENYRKSHETGFQRAVNTGKYNLVGKGYIEITALRKNGEEFPIELALDKTDTENGPIFISYIRDITTRKLSEDALRSARDEALSADKAKSRFLAIMSHEMRTPLNGISGALEILSQSKLNKQQNNLLKVAQTSSDILKRNIDDVLDISRINSQAMEIIPEPTDIIMLLHSIKNEVQAFADTNNNKIKITTADLYACAYLIDPHRIRQIIINLVNNAINFTKNGKITITLSETIADTNKSNLIITVSDTGVGIPDEHKKDVFKPFFTRDYSYTRNDTGTGLGLAICQKLVTLMNGDISFKSMEGKGTSFTVSIPAEHKEATPSKEENPSDDIHTPYVVNKTILLVDDNNINRTVTSKILENLGATVIQAENGMKAIKASFREKYDLILMDISMPEMDGIRATETIKMFENKNKNTPIVALTAHALPAEQESYKKAGMVYNLTKPISNKDIQKMLATVLPHTTPVSKKEILIDETIFSNLRSVLKDHEFNENYHKFITEIDEAIPKITELFAKKNIPELQKRTHLITGSAGLFGASALHNLLTIIELSCKTNKLDNATESIEKLPDVWARTKTTLNNKTEF